MVKTKKKRKQVLNIMHGEKVIKILAQTSGLKIKNRDIKRDQGRSAKLPGKRLTKQGTIYWETRPNRSDSPLKAI